MSTIAAELTLDGNFKLLGGINTRAPTITQGLIANYPFDGITVDTVSSAIPLVNSNNTLTASEISIEESTTNLVTNGDLSSGITGWSVNQSVTISTIKPDGYTNYLQVVSNQATSTPGFISTNALSVSPNTTYTFSLEGYKSYSGSCYLYVWASTTGNLVWHGAALSIVEQKYINTFTTGASDTSIKVGVLWSGVAAGDWFRVKKIQVEQKAFATAFTKTSRSLGATRFTNILGTEGTIAFKFSKDVVPSSGYQMPFRVENNVFEFNITTSTYLGAAPQSIVQYTDYWAFITWSLSNNFLKRYFGRVMVGSSVCPSYVSGFGTTYPYFYLGCGSSAGDYVFNGSFKNFLIYDRVLSDNEIKELATNAFELTSSGNLISSSIKISPYVPPDARYFPLGLDSNDLYKVISPVEDLNSVYENSFVWVGAAVTNAFTNYTTPIFASAYNGTNYGFGAGTDLQQVAINSYKLIPSCAITKVSRITGGTSQRDYVYNATVSEAGSTKIISFWYYGTYGTIFRPYNNDGSATLYYLKSDGTWSSGSTAISVPVTTNEWQKITLKMVNNGTTGTGLTWMILHYDTATATLDNSQYWMFTGWQVTTSLIEYPFIAGTRSATSLKFADMKTSPQLPSTKPFTYFITFKVFPGANTTQTPLFSCTEGGGFNLSIDGSGNLRSEVHNGTGYNGTTTSNYDYRDGKVHIATLVVGASDVIMYLDGIEVGRAAGWMTGVDVYYGTANYNLFLGVENDNGTASSTQFLNGYLRDFICIPRELSATEIHDVTQIKLDMASGARIQGNIATSQVLI